MIVFLHYLIWSIYIFVKEPRAGYLSALDGRLSHGLLIFTQEIKVTTSKNELKINYKSDKI
jgi:hypothetical protein